MTQKTPADFRVDFPEFFDEQAFPDSTIQTQLTMAYRLLNAERWGDILDFGVELRTAHWLSLGRKNLVTAQAGGSPGTQVGIANSKKAGSVQIGYDTATATLEGAGYWNLTTYGIQYWQFVQIFGAGPVQVNQGPEPTLYPGSAWPGPVLGWY